MCEEEETDNWAAQEKNNTESSRENDKHYQKHVRRTGSIEVLLNTSADETAETLTCFSEDSVDCPWESSSFEVVEDGLEEERLQHLSRCGLSRDIHEALLESGKMIYDCVGESRDEMAVDFILGVSEMSEEYSNEVCPCGCG